MNILVLNCGSSSLKFQLIRTDLDLIQHGADVCLAYGQIERIGGAAIVEFSAENSPAYRSAEPIRDIRSAVEKALRWIRSESSGIDAINSLGDIQGVGHRVVHGGEHFSESVLITDEVLRGIEDCIELAPVHNPANIRGYLAARDVLGSNVPQAAVFDTAFHHTLPERSFIYPIPYQFYRRHKIRRYGFHGTSHRYAAYRYRHLKKIDRDNINIITLHLGNGCSITAIKGGNSIDTSMGLTPLEGLVMGSRSGDLDPAIIDFLCSKEGASVNEVETILNTQSGLLGISGLTNDMRELLEEANENNDRRARLAIEIFCYRAAKYIGAYLAAMNGAEAIIFAGGIGENSPYIRERICENLEWFGVKLDSAANDQISGGREGVISTANSRPDIYVVPTNEELLIARDTVRLIISDLDRF